LSRNEICNTLQPRDAPHYFAVPAKTERRFIAAGMAGYRAVVVDRQPGEGPGLGSDGREADKRSLTGPIFDIKTEVIY